MTYQTNRPICPVCKKRKVHHTKSLSSACYPCFSQMVKNGTWENWVTSK